jgi:L-lactate dehydrogenase complex protein LldG
MSTEARSEVLAAIRRALHRGEGAVEAAQREVEQRLTHPAASVVPARAEVTGEARIAAFIAEAERVNAVTRRVAALTEVPALLASELRARNWPGALRCSADRLIAAIPWANEPMLTVATGAAGAEDRVSVTAAFAGIAETGTLMLVSSPESPTSLNFLPELHVVVLPCAWIVGAYEEALACLRQRLGETGERPRGESWPPGKDWPRTINWITGPSRTADIEQTLLLGAHGPKQLLIVLVDAEPRAPR